MKRFPSPIPSISCIATVLLILVTARPANAEQFEDFAYQVNGDETVTIADYPRDAVGQVEIPAQIDGKAVTAIGSHAFADCTGLTSVSIPASVTEIGRSAFRGCTGLTSVSIPGSVTEIRDYAFHGCTGLTSVTISEGVTVIGRAFYGCTTLTSVEIPASVTEISRWAFDGCPALQTINVAPGNPHYSSQDGVLFNAEKTVLVRCPEGKAGSYAIPAGVERLSFETLLLESAFAFAGCQRLTEILIPSTLNTPYHPIQFSECSRLAGFHVAPGNPAYSSRDGVLFNGDMTNLLRCPEGKTGHYRIPDGVTCLFSPPFTGTDSPGRHTLLGSGAFENCRELTSLSVPASISDLGDLWRDWDLEEDEWTRQGVGTWVFAGCRNLESIEVDPGNPVYFSQDGVLFTSSRTTLILCPEGKKGLYTIPDGVSRIAGGTVQPTPVNSTRYDFPGAFRGCVGLTCVTIPSSVREILPRAFSGCTELAAVICLGDAPTVVSQVDSSGNPLPDLGWGSGHYSFGAQGTAGARDATVYFLRGANGFTAPPSVLLEDAPTPTETWLLAHRIPHGTDLHQDLNNDGVSLLMAYALDLDPRQNLRGRLPTPVLDGDNLAMSFQGNSAGITYTVQTGTDLQSWTTEGVTTYGPDAVGIRTATVPRDMPQRFLRLLVE